MPHYEEAADTAVRTGQAIASGVVVERWVVERLLVTEEVAALLRVTHETVREMVRRGELDAAQIGRGWKFRAADVSALVERRMGALRDSFAGGGK